jgi:alcohol dehydrogenase
MRAWRLTIPGRLELVDGPDPVVRPGSVVVRVEAAPVMSYLREFVAGRLPGYHPPAGAFTPGTSAVGVIEEVGPDVYTVRAGERVLATGHYTAAENVPEPAQALLGITGDPAVLATWPDGTFAERVVAPVSTVTPLPVGGVGLTRCLVPYGGLLRGGMEPGETVVVTGATGAFGSAAVAVAVAMGARRVVAAGRNRAVLERLSTLGRVVVVPLIGEDDAAALRRAADGPIDLAVDMVGGATDPQATLDALSALRRGGRLVLTGSATAPLPVDYTAVMLSGKEIRGSFMYPRDAPARLLRLVEAGLLDLTTIPVTHLPLAALPEAMDRAAEPGAPLVAVGG